MNFIGKINRVRGRRKNPTENSYGYNISTIIAFEIEKLP